MFTGAAGNIVQGASKIRHAGKLKASARFLEI
jgi:hypothetical protein